jgi:MraZ protein
VDPKGRVFVPKRFHPFIPFNEEGARVVMLTAGMDGCLYLFTEKGHAAELSRLDVGTFAGREARAMQRMLFRFTSRTNLDASGRLLIPERYREMAGIGDSGLSSSRLPQHEQKHRIGSPCPRSARLPLARRRLACLGP